MAFSLKGRTGALRVGGRPALAFAAYTLATREPADGGGWRLDAKVAAKDDYWLGRATEYDLRLDLSRRVWRWRNVPAAAVSVSGEDVTITHTGEPDDA